MKKLNKFLFIMCFLAFSGIANAQSSFSIGGTQLYTSFHFSDSQSNNMDSEYKGLYTGSYGVNYRYITDFGLLVRPGIGIRYAGANTLYDNMDYLWKLQYADANLGIGYIYNKNNVNPYFITSGYYSYLLSGTQILNNQHININNPDLFNNMDYGIIFTPGVQFKLSENIATFIEFNYLWGLKNLETNLGQTTTNFSYGLTFGLSFSISK